MKQKAITQNRLLILSGILFAFVIAEIGLRLAATVYLAGRAYRNRISFNKKADYRILCLGESTTVEGAWDSYPRQMERILIQRLFPMSFTVINKGSPGADTNFILSNLEQNLDQYDPDIVIVMMGINDKLVNSSKIPFYHQEKNMRYQLKNFIKQLKIFKLIKIVWVKIHEKQVLKRLYFDRAKYFQENQNYPRAEKLLKKLISLDPGAHDAYLELARHYDEAMNYPRAEEIYSQAIRLCPGNADIYQEAGWFYYKQGNFMRAQNFFKEALNYNNTNALPYVNLGQSYYAQGKIEMAEDLFNRAIEMNPKDEEVLLAIGDCYQENGDYLKAEKIFNALLKLNPGNAAIYVALGNCFDAQGKFIEAEKMLKKSLEIDPKADINYEGLGGYYEKQQQFFEAEKIYRQYINEVRGTANYSKITLRNYKKLKKIILERGIKLVCVQYPRRPLKPLTQIFDSNKGVIFVDNERIFEDAVNTNVYEDYFIDRFAGDFGHCTPKGNQLLASSIAEAIIRFILKDNGH